MRQSPRKIIYVCNAVKNGDLISRMIDINNIDDACIIFEKENGIKPQTIFGPFYRKKTSMLNRNCEIKFKSNETKKGTFNGWYITAVMLDNPPESAHIFYDKRIDGQKAVKPSLTIIKLKEFQEIK